MGMGRSVAKSGFRLTVRKNGLPGSSCPAVNGTRSNSGKTVWRDAQSPA